MDKPNRCTRFLLLAFSIIFSCLALEVGARLYLTQVAQEEVFQVYASLNQLRDRYGDDYLTSSVALYAPHPYLGHYPSPNYEHEANRHNALGFRGDEIALPKPADTYRIVCLGGSTTYGDGVKDYKLSYPYLLQGFLRQNGYPSVEVINAGAGNYSSFESLINLSLRVLELEPDMIIIYHGINDIHPRLVWPPSAYQGDNTGARAANIGELRMPHILEYSTALRMVLVTLQVIEPHYALEGTLVSRPATYNAKEFEHQQRTGTYPSGIFADVPAQAMLDANPPLYFDQNIRNMIAIADANDIAVVLATFAYSPDFDEPYVSTPEYQAAYDDMNAVVRHIAVTTPATVYDFAADMPTNREYFTDGRHFTAQGNQLRAELFGTFLAESGLLP